MSYYAGDYYAGGYYAGGIFGSIGRALGRVAKVGIGTVGGILTGGPIGGIRGTIAAAVPAIATGIRQETLAAGDTGSAYTPALRAKHAMVVARAGGSGAGGAPKLSTALPPPGMSMVPAGVGPVPAFVGPPMMAPGFGARGHHINKHGYFTHAEGYVPAGAKLVRNRRMNWGNGRALSRAERRIASFLHHATRYMRWAGKKGKALPKLRRRKKK